MTSVLQPLDKKVQEYNAQMYEEQHEMAQLDAQMAILQERRREAEKRYIAAKSKHDDYRRQFQGVERALRGEPDMFSQLTLQE
jgi:predicted  nucleic acid-binding Zn-ribbon protein